MTSIQIHEFSTGIRPQINADGSWVSLGFTGQYMNATIDPIPYAVERSIANKEFAVAEGAFSNQPAVIGRVVLDNENSGWSVVALVSRGQDEKGRSASFYRYFLCEGIDNLSSIVAWIESYEQDNHSKPIFNPSDTKVLGQATEFNHQNVSYSQTNFVANSDSTPIIIHPNEKRTLEQINNLATKNANGQPVAWAVNVEALEKPWSFIVIQAASDSAYEILQRTAANSPKNKAPVVDEQALKSAIKSLMGSSTVKSEAVDTLTEALGNNQVNEQYWHTLFDEQGARNAISQKIYNRQMVRLLTLRVLVIPETLPEYLDWLNVKENANRRDLNSNIISSLEFQSNLTNLIYSQPENSILKNKLDELFKKIKVYQPSAKLLEKLGDYCSNNLHNSELSLLYYQLAAYFSARTNNQNVIPNKLFQKAFSHHRGYEDIFDTKIYSQQYQQYLRRQGELIVPIPNVIVYVFLSFLLGGLGGFLIAGNIGERPETVNQTAEAPDGPTDTSQSNNYNQNIDTQTPKKNPEITPIPKGKKQKDALTNFDKETIPSINKVINDLEQKHPKEKIILAVKEVLGNPNLDDSLLNKEPAEINEQFKNDWIDAIYSYQLRNNPTNPDIAQGYIRQKGKVIDYFKPDVEKELGTKDNKSNPPSGE